MDKVNGLTSNGYEFIKNRIKEMKVLLPTDTMTTYDLVNWLNGYHAAMKQILGLIDDISEGNRQY